MDKIKVDPQHQRHHKESDQDFKIFSRPLTSRLLEAMELAKNYYHGEGDYLFYEEAGKINRVLDLTGGYGANILGHRHPAILAKVQDWLENGAPSLTQGSLRKNSGVLAKKISDTLIKETGEGPWITTFSNSGTEAVEAAIKHALCHYQTKIITLAQEIEKEINQAVAQFKQMEPNFQTVKLMQLRKQIQDQIDALNMSSERKSFLFHQILNTQTIEDLVSLLREINQKQESVRPKLIALEKGYHGKTMGALSITSSENFRGPFYLSDEYNEHTIFISQYIDQNILETILNTTKLDLLFIRLDTKNNIQWGKHTISTIAAGVIEPIQGEAGVIPVTTDFLGRMKKASIENDFLLIFDEIQTGMYRTGYLSAATESDITPDIYTFSKSLGGGIAKIGATTILSRKYIEDFGLLHTSTFSDDDFSASVALEVFNTIQTTPYLLDNAINTADILKIRLSELQNKFPHLIKDIRGKGFMLAIEFEDILSEMGIEFRIISDTKMQGYLLATTLLNHEHLRMSPSLSNNLTLRIQPSLFFKESQIEETIIGLEHLCQAMADKNITYFLSALYPHNAILNLQSPPLITNLKLGEKPISVFLCHLIDETQIKNASNPLKDVVGKDITHKLAQTKDIAEFKIYHTQRIKDKDGHEMDIVMLAIPITSEELKRSFTSRKRYKIVQKVQNAIDYAKELGATTVGLGQFTSIVSGNGLYLDPRGLNITTGNGYTIALTIQSALRSTKEKNINLSETTAALVGAAGNIMSVATSLIADHVKKVILVHHTTIESSLKFQEATKRILDEIAQSTVNSPVTEVIKELWSRDKHLIDFLNNPRVQKVFVTTGDITEIKDADIILLGASATGGIINSDTFKVNAVIVDVAVPSSLNKELVNQITEKRKDITYHLGGVAQIPQDQSINFSMLPLPYNQCYACMAETFAIGFSGEKNFFNIGDLNKSIVQSVEILAEKAGFKLGQIKDKNSL